MINCGPSSGGSSSRSSSSSFVTKEMKSASCFLGSWDEVVVDRRVCVQACLGDHFYPPSSPRLAVP